MSTASHGIIVVGGGFTGLAAAYELARSGQRVTILEADDRVGGLARGFAVPGGVIERFYHHWFRSDWDILDLIRELRLEQEVTWRSTQTGLYYNKTSFQLSGPLDVLRFTPLGLADRIRLGRLVLQARAVADWRSIEHLTAREWIEQMSGRRVYEVVWAPLLEGKFGPYAERVSAVWFWKKLALRGGSRARSGKEMLGYFDGGFEALTQALSREIQDLGGVIHTGTRVSEVIVANGRVGGVRATTGIIDATGVLLATPLPIATGLLESHLDGAVLERLCRIDHLANVCLVLELDRSLSSTYWLNVNDPDFPFGGVIEHTNLEPASSYGGRHIVYLSKYLPKTDELWSMGDEEVLSFAVPHLQRMFPEFLPEWVLGHHVWRADYAQPIIEPFYSRIRPSYTTSIEGLYLSTMAHIYPEDRGTNYAVRDGRSVARMMMKETDQRYRR